MSWLKKNLSLVVGGVVALGLLGFAIFFLLTSTRAADEVTAQLSAKTAELKDLTTHDPYPNQENIEAARREQKKLAEFLQGSRRFFVPVSSFTNVDSAAFKDLLETTISHLENDAEKAGVNLPNKYDFTFAPQRKSLDFAADTLAPLAAQVAEIKAVCEVLFAARVHALTALRRLPVAKDDQAAHAEDDHQHQLPQQPTRDAVARALQRARQSRLMRHREQRHAPAKRPLAIEDEIRHQDEEGKESSHTGCDSRQHASGAADQRPDYRGHVFAHGVRVDVQPVCIRDVVQLF